MAADRANARAVLIADVPGHDVPYSSVGAGNARFLQKAAEIACGGVRVVAGNEAGARAASCVGRSAGLCAASARQGL